MDRVPLTSPGIDASLSAEQLLPLVYDELRRLAASRMSGDPAGLTLQPTALVHEAWIRLGAKFAGDWEGREHFFNAIARTMRRILIERARRKASLKRGGGDMVRSEWDPALAVPEDDLETDFRLLQLDEIVLHLEAEDPEGARIVSLKIFAGMTNAEVANVFGVTERTIERKWALLKIRLYQLARGLAAGQSTAEI